MMATVEALKEKKDIELLKTVLKERRIVINSSIQKL